jgi:hypothetical protein
MKYPSFRTERIGLYQTFFTDTYINLLFPMSLAWNWFYTYHVNGINDAHFDCPNTRSLNSVLYYSAQIMATFIVGLHLISTALTILSVVKMLSPAFSFYHDSLGGGVTHGRSIPKLS